MTGLAGSIDTTEGGSVARTMGLLFEVVDERPSPWYPEIFRVTPYAALRNEGESLASSQITCPLSGKKADKADRGARSVRSSEAPYLFDLANTRAASTAASPACRLQRRR